MASMYPILLIHGYSAESKTTATDDIEAIYGTLPQRLRNKYGTEVVRDIDLSRYISLDDGITIDDVSRALNYALLRDFPDLLFERFNVIVHSTGALVIRNWLRLFSSKPSPVSNIVYLAGANFGSGWAHLGQGQLAQWGRFVFENGAERGIEILDALEWGSSKTLDLHIGFTKSGNSPYIDYTVQEFILVGSQAHPSFLEMPIACAKEDGSDGVVRVSGSNLNYNYVRFRPITAASQLSWEAVTSATVPKVDEISPSLASFYEIAETSLVGSPARPEVPFAIPFGCSHTGADTGIVDGTNQPLRDQVFRLLTTALETPPGGMANTVTIFQNELSKTYEEVKTAAPPDLAHEFGWNLKSQYDPHAQLIFRLVDQDGREVPHFDIFFNGENVGNTGRIQKLFEDTYLEYAKKNIIVYFLRVCKWDETQREWLPLLEDIDQCTLQITFVEPASSFIKYLPFRFVFDSGQLQSWLVGHRTTIIDIEVLRLPDPDVFKIVKFPLPAQTK